jgi:hypothetical protein
VLLVYPSPFLEAVGIAAIVELSSPLLPLVADLLNGRNIATSTRFDSNFLASAHSVKSGSDPRGTLNADGVGVRNRVRYRRR